MGRMRFFRRGQSDGELQRKVSCMEEEVAENVGGMGADEARRRAHVKFGSAQRVREEVWEGVVSWVGSYGGFGLCGEAAEEGAVGCVDGDGFAGAGDCGECSGLFGREQDGVAGAAGWRSGQLDECVFDRSPWTDRGVNKYTLSSRACAGRSRSFSGAAGLRRFCRRLCGQGEPERVWGQSATVNFFDVAEVPMVLGRGFEVMKSTRRWWCWVMGCGCIPSKQTAGVVGKTVSLSGKPFTVIGVARPGFMG